MPPIIGELFGLFGFLVRVLGFLLFGFAIGKFVLDQFKSAGWQTQVALALGFFALAASFTRYATPGAAGAFALGAAAAFLMTFTPKKSEEEDKEEKGKKK
ncbi:MAG: hypothetical protein OZ914_02055 [Anaerolineaceae bacterium]|jgi:uncharacterized membrane protein|nr:hypothetical protein [Anaerolineaceae bacterium]OQY90698.1 MAG: hypothetical protein B6D38_02915 [Anaerolineae bacterium UTCFX1]